MPIRRNPHKHVSFYQAMQFTLFAFTEYLMVFFEFALLAGLTLVSIGVTSALAHVMFKNYFASESSMELFAGASSGGSVLYILSTIGGLIHNLIAQPSGWIFLIGGLSMLISIMIYSLITIACVTFANRLYDDQNPSLNKYSEFNIWLGLKVLAGMFVYFIITMLGSIAFVIPGLYFFVSRAFFLQSMIYHKKGIFEAFAESAQLTKKNGWWTVASTFFLVTIINGLLIVVPSASIFAFGGLGTVFMTYVYRSLLQEDQQKEIIVTTDV